MRLIDADALIDTLGVSDEDINFRGLLGEAPSIEIVRCGECKHWHKKDDLTYCDRIDYGYGYKADDFCSYGSRSEKPNNSKERSGE